MGAAEQAVRHVRGQTDEYAMDADMHTMSAYARVMRLGMSKAEKTSCSRA